MWDYFDSDIGKDSARAIREFHIPDFSKWKTDHDAYKLAFDRLLIDLKGETAIQPTVPSPYSLFPRSPRPPL
ncbi:MAG: hypothetical protein ABSG96_17890 [Terracidiphilus sp.]|jgi:hypothetical protein